MYPDIKFWGWGNLIPGLTWNHALNQGHLVIIINPKGGHIFPRLEDEETGEYENSAWLNQENLEIIERRSSFLPSLLPAISWLLTLCDIESHCFLHTQWLFRNMLLF